MGSDPGYGQVIDTARVAEYLPNLINPLTLVVSLQNGLGNWEALGKQGGGRDQFC